ncbi:MAG: SDR family oxidoreductase [Hyphomicrobium sp.]
MKHLFCFGLGYCARALVQRLDPSMWTVSGTATSPDGVQKLSSIGAQGLLFNGSAAHADVAAALATATHVLMSIPPAGDGDPAYRHHGADIAASPAVSWIGYFSTIGVYGDAAGGWVDEETPAVPGSIRGQRRLNAENDWRRLAHAHGKRVAVFRLPGIYGPGRSVLDDVRDGSARRIVKPGQVFNRAHVDDIAAAVHAAIVKADRGDALSDVFNITDDEPAPPQTVIEHAARLIGAELPPALDFATADLSDMTRSFYSESKRVGNARMKRELEVVLRYPTYREGLAALLADGA